MVSGGLFEAAFNHAEMLKPAKVIINGRASFSFGDTKVDVSSLTEEIARTYIKKVLPTVDKDAFFEFLHLTNDYSHNPNWFHPQSLDDLPDHTKPYANDAATFSSYWPPSPIEQTVLAIEGSFYNEDATPKFPFIGQDIKVLAVRKDKDVSFVLCVPQIPILTESHDVYVSRKKDVHTMVEVVTREMLPEYNVSININTADGHTGEKHYLLITGSCIEAGEEGVVGRGNKSRGVISSTRPSSMEAISGKNPVYHVGKVWAAVCDSLAKSVSETFDCSCEVHVSTKNGDPLYNPEEVVINASNKLDRAKVNMIVENHLSYKRWTDDIINKALFVPKLGKGNDYSIN